MLKDERSDVLLSVRTDDGADALVHVDDAVYNGDDHRGGLIGGAV